MQETEEMQVQPPSQEDPLEEGMATHSNILAWRIPWTEEPGGQGSIGSQRVGHNASNLAAAASILQMRKLSLGEVNSLVQSHTACEQSTKALNLTLPDIKTHSLTITSSCFPTMNTGPVFLSAERGTTSLYFHGCSIGSKSL